MYYKVTNLIQNDGRADYKGISLKSIVAGSQKYDIGEENACVLISNEVITHPELVQLTEVEYENYLTYQSPQPVNEIEEIQNSLADLWEVVLLGGNG